VRFQALVNKRESNMKAQAPGGAWMKSRQRLSTSEQ
jgi:hypothetical protein